MNTLLLTLALLTMLQDVPLSQEQTPQIPTTVMIGRVTGTSVNVRSGPSTNFYPIAKLNEDDRVVVHEVRHGWAHITPPPGCYSLVQKHYVDPDGEDRGVINGNRVWVHPGSDLTVGPYYAKQLRLDRGAAVTIVGELDDYYKIAPPSGAKVWISADYLDIIEDEVEPDIAVQKAQELAETVPPAPSDEDIADSVTKNDIELIEMDLEFEFHKPVMERNFEPYIARFREIAEREGEYAAQQYATYRIGQLQKTITRIDALSRIQELAVKVQQQREAFLRERANIRPHRRHIEQNFAARGKLIRSFAYDQPAGPQRYRLVDPEGPAQRTLAYVEIDPDSNINIEEFLGRYVGVRSKNQRLIQGAVDAVVVYSAAELVILEHVETSPLDTAQSAP